MTPPQTNPTPSSNPTMFYFSIFLFAIISYLLYKFVLSPAPTEPTPSSSVVTQRNATASTSRLTAPSSSTTTVASNDAYFSYGTPRHPPHFVPPEKWDRSTSLSKYLLQGIVPFRSTHANGYETRLQKQQSSDADADIIVTHRKERARIFARLFSLSAEQEEGSSKKKPPPNRGANIVVTIQPSDVSCAKLQKAFMLLGTYYNLFVLVDAKDLFNKNNGGDGSKQKQQQQQQQQQREYIQNFRSELLNSKKSTTTTAIPFRLNPQILPPHRIVFLSTPEGRVAFVRQLQGVELVVDGDEKVTRELERFGHCVLVYPRDGGEGGHSALGKFLVP
ncbi:hypothetical protein ACHAW6_005714 [Cyclotella cf. meneghiniana]